MINVIQEMMGYCLTAETRAEKAFYLYGSGSNGKSVLAKIIKELVGRENVSSISISDMSKQFGLQSIIDKTVNISAENEISDIKGINTENFKAVTSGDPMTIDIKYKAPIQYTPICKLIFLVNSLPNTADVTHGYFRKLLIVHFNQKFTDGNKDVNLFEKIRNNEMSGVLNWTLEGLKRLRENDYQFTESKAINDLVEKYQEEQNPVIRFFKDILTLDGQGKISRKEILNQYQKWIMLQGIDDRNSKSNQVFWKLFNAAIDKLGITLKSNKIQGQRGFKGIKLKSDLVQASNESDLEFDA